MSLGVCLNHVSEPTFGWHADKIQKINVPMKKRIFYPLKKRLSQLEQTSDLPIQFEKTCVLNYGRTSSVKSGKASSLTNFLD